MRRPAAIAAFAIAGTATLFAAAQLNAYASEGRLRALETPPIFGAPASARLEVTGPIAMSDPACTTGATCLTQEQAKDGSNRPAKIDLDGNRSAAAPAGDVEVDALKDVWQSEIVLNDMSGMFPVQYASNAAIGAPAGGIGSAGLPLPAYGLAAAAAIGALASSGSGAQSPG